MHHSVCMTAKQADHTLMLEKKVLSGLSMFEFIENMNQVQFRIKCVVRCKAKSTYSRYEDTSSVWLKLSDTNSKV